MALATARLTPADAGEVLTLQRAAYATEAQLYGDPFLPALTQTLDELRAELDGPGLGIREHGRLEAEAASGASVFELFTGHLSLANIRLYEREGYVEFRREQLQPGVELVFLRKAAHV